MSIAPSLRSQPLQADAALVARVQQLVGAPDGMEQAIVFLRGKGQSKIESIQVLIVAAGLSLGDAKERIEASVAWADLRERDRQFHETLFRVAERLSKEGCAERAERSMSAKVS